MGEVAEARKEEDRKGGEEEEQQNGRNKVNIQNWRGWKRYNFRSGHYRNEEITR